MNKLTVTPATVGLTVDALRREGNIIRCPRCKRELYPWPLGHRVCAPKDWVRCIATGLTTILVDASQ